MNALGHIVVGIVSTGAAQYVFHLVPYQPGPMFVGAACAVCGALAPDIDHPVSTMSQRMHIGRGQLFGCAGALLRWAVGGHRGLTHQWWFVILCSFVLGYFTPDAFRNYALVFLIGYISHLLVDKLL